jgi:hypothetical protein
MSLSQRQMKQLEKIVALASNILTEASKSGASEKNASTKRIRRSGKELVAFRKMLKAERKKGVSVVELAKIHGVSTAYIYQL